MHCVCVYFLFFVFVLLFKETRQTKRRRRRKKKEIMHNLCTYIFMYVYKSFHFGNPKSDVKPEWFMFTGIYCGWTLLDSAHSGVKCPLVKGIFSILLPYALSALAHPFFHRRRAAAGSSYTPVPVRPPFCIHSTAKKKKTLMTADACKNKNRFTSWSSVLQ